jgi:ATP-binding protein involved in chromosome partitioning
MGNITEDKVLEALRHVEDPDLKKDLVSLNMIRDLKIEGNRVSFSVVLTTPACPLKDLIQRACINAILHYVDKDAQVVVNMTSHVTSARGNDKPLLPQVKNIIAVASGKGGVGKSTIAANLAIALTKLGAKVGLVDADIYGPSVPLMFDVVYDKPATKQIDGQNYMMPIESYGVKLLSIGFFADPEQAIVWRGPMASKALTQLFRDAYWGELDYMIVDLPPGTGDIHLSLVQSVPITGAIVVTTPQEVALADARKAIGMFKMPGINVPLLGIVENMAWFTPEELPQNKYFIFGKDGGKDLAERIQVPLLAQIPLVQGIRESGDIGRPAALNEFSLQGKAFIEFAKNVARQVAILNSKHNNPSLAKSE